MTDDNQLTVRRTFDAPRERVWRAFTDPDELAQWFVPAGMEAEVHALDPVPGGGMSVSWTGEEHQMDNEGTFEEVVKHERLVTVEETPQGVNRVTYEFHDADDGTKVVLTHELPDAQMVDGASEGWGGFLNNLEGVIANM
ncbi:SRPBCC family protein [Haladaptatus sp. NG-WS-4]